MAYIKLYKDTGHLDRDLIQHEGAVIYHSTKRSHKYIHTITGVPSFPEYQLYLDTLLLEAEGMQPPVGLKMFGSETSTYTSAEDLRALDGSYTMDESEFRQTAQENAVYTPAWNINAPRGLNNTRFGYMDYVLSTDVEVGDNFTESTIPSVGPKNVTETFTLSDLDTDEYLYAICPYATFAATGGPNNSAASSNSTAIVDAVSPGDVFVSLAFQGRIRKVFKFDKTDSTFEVKAKPTNWSANDNLLLQITKDSNEFRKNSSNAIAWHDDGGWVDGNGAPVTLNLDVGINGYPEEIYISDLDGQTDPLVRVGGISLIDNLNIGDASSSTDLLNETHFRIVSTIVDTTPVTSLVVSTTDLST